VHADASQGEVSSVSVAPLGEMIPRTVSARPRLPAGPERRLPSGDERHLRPGELLLHKLGDTGAGGGFYAVTA
jgi:hypothetical protein